MLWTSTAGSILLSLSVMLHYWRSWKCGTSTNTLTHILFFPSLSHIQPPHRRKSRLTIWHAKTINLVVPHWLQLRLLEQLSPFHLNLLSGKKQQLSIHLLIFHRRTERKHWHCERHLSKIKVVLSVSVTCWRCKLFLIKDNILNSGFPK